MGNFARLLGVSSAIWTRFEVPFRPDDVSRNALRALAQALLYRKETFNHPEESL